MALKHAQTAGPTPPPRPPTSIGVHRRQWPLASSLASSTSERSPIRTHAPNLSCSRLSNSEQNVAWVVQSRLRQAGQRRQLSLAKHVVSFAKQVVSSPDLTVLAKHLVSGPLSS